MINTFIKQQQNDVSVGDSTVGTEDFEEVTTQNYVSEKIKLKDRNGTRF